MSQQKPDPELLKIQGQLIEIKNQHSRMRGQFLDNLSDATTMMLDAILSKIVMPMYEENKALKARVTKLESEKKSAEKTDEKPIPKQPRPNETE